MNREASIFDPPGGEVVGQRPAPWAARIRPPVHCVRQHTPACASAPKPSAFSSIHAAKKISVFCHGFAAVAAVAQALERTVKKQLQISPVWDHVVSHRRPNTKPMTGALPAERLAGQLSASASCPTISWVCVQVMPGSGILPLPLPLVVRAIAISSQLLAARRFTHSHRFVHDCLPRKTKKPEPRIASCDTWLRL